MQLHTCIDSMSKEVSHAADALARSGAAASDKVIARTMQQLLGAPKKCVFDRLYTDSQHRGERFRRRSVRRQEIAQLAHSACWRYSLEQGSELLVIKAPPVQERACPPSVASSCRSPSPGPVLSARPLSPPAQPLVIKAGHERASPPSGRSGRSPSPGVGCSTSILRSRGVSVPPAQELPNAGRNRLGGLPALALENASTCSAEQRGSAAQKCGPLRSRTPPRSLAEVRSVVGCQAAPDACLPAADSASRHPLACGGVSARPPLPATLAKMGGDSLAIGTATTPANLVAKRMG